MKYLTKKQKQELKDARAKLIIESFTKEFNKIKRVDEIIGKDNFDWDAYDKLSPEEKKAIIKANDEKIERNKTLDNNDSNK